MRVAEGFLERLRGLAFADAGQPLFIPRCRSVHTFGMRYALDLFWLDERNDLARVDRDVPPRRVARCSGAAAVLEAPASGP